MAAEVSAWQMSHVISLESVAPHIDENIVRQFLRHHGEITKVQFWTADDKRRHGFVTFENSYDARNCLRLAKEIDPVLHVGYPRAIEQYQIPQIPSTGTFRALKLIKRPTPSLLRKTLDIESLTPLDRGDLEEGEYSAFESEQETSRPDSISLLQTEESQSLPASLSCQIDAHLPSRFSSPAKANYSPSAVVPLLPAYTLTPISPSFGSGTFGHAEADPHGRADKTVTSLMNEITKLHLDLRNSKEASDKSLRFASEEKERYRAERDTLSKELRKMKREADYYRAKADDLADDLADKASSHRKKRKDLKYDLHEANEKVSKLKSELKNLSQLHSQQQLELDESQRKLQAVHESMHSSGSSGDLDDASKGSEASISSIFSSTATSNHSGDVLPALEKAFIYLEEMTATVLMQTDGAGNEGESSERACKRQRRGDDV